MAEKKTRRKTKKTADKKADADDKAADDKAADGDEEGGGGVVRDRLVRTVTMERKEDLSPEEIEKKIREDYPDAPRPIPQQTYEIRTRVMRRRHPQDQAKQIPRGMSDVKI